MRSLRKTVVFGLLISIILLFSLIPVSATQEFELWTESPSITSGVTVDMMNIYRAMDLNEFDLYKLDRLGTNIYLATCEAKTSYGGYNGKTKTSDLYAYTLLANDNDFIILSGTTFSNEYYWDYGVNIRDLVNDITNAGWYTTNGCSVPYYLFQPNGKYTNSNWTETFEYVCITSSGQLGKVSTSNPEYPFVYNGILYRQANGYYSGSNYYNYTINYDLACKMTPFAIQNGNLSYTSNGEFMVLRTSVTAANGYRQLWSDLPSNQSSMCYYKISGTDNLYFLVGNSPRYENGYTYYDTICTTYRITSGNITQLNQCSYKTANTYPYTPTVQSLGDIDKTYYASKGSAVPKYIINNNQIVVNDDGTVTGINFSTTDSTNFPSWYVCVYNNRLGVVRDRDSKGVFYVNYNYQQKINDIIVKNNVISLQDSYTLNIVGYANTGQNGYYKYYNNYIYPTLNSEGYATVKSWWGRCKTNVFPDGRYVQVYWQGVGSNVYELWYSIYNTDGIRRANGPTGYSTSFGSTFDTYALYAITVNNSKFVVALNQVGHSFMREYYRVAVVQENTTGEVTAGGNIGVKGISPPNTTDTIPVQSQIDFAQNDLPLGYNIKDGVINENKFETNLRQDLSGVNNIRLNDIVIIKKTGYISGLQNTGQTLDSYSNYSYDYGSSYIRLYTNGTNFQWYCYNPENLTVGEYNKSIVIGRKTIYFKIKVIAPPTNTGTTTVTF